RRQPACRKWVNFVGGGVFDDSKRWINRLDGRYGRLNLKRTFWDARSVRTWFGMRRIFRPRESSARDSCRYPRPLGSDSIVESSRANRNRSAAAAEIYSYA